jgi:hypothetical protein
LVPGLPYQTGGAIFSSTFFPGLWAGGTSVASPLPAEFFMNFGAPGALIGFVLFGGLLGSLEAYYRRSRGRRIGPLLIYAYSLVPVAGILRGDLTTFLGYPLLVVAPVLIAQRFIEARTRLRPQTLELSLSPGAKVGS